jgi:adenylate cyclase
MSTSTDVLHGKILIVDDQQANVLLLEQMLRGAGYDAISSTRDASKVFELHLVNRYDLILLDIQMPGMDGFQVMENLRELEQGGYLPVLVVTAQPAHKLRALKAGALDFVSKPFDLAEVLARVHNLLQVRLLHQETRRLHEQVVAEQRVSQRLLVEALPANIARRLEAHPQVAPPGAAGLVAESYAEVTVLFADLVEFTRFSEGASAEVLAGVLDEISAGAGGPAGHPGLDRKRIVGDAYLAAVGSSDAVADRSIRAASKALDLVEALDRFNAHGRFKLKVRIGLDRGAGAAARAGRRTSLHDL